MMDRDEIKRNCLEKWSDHKELDERLQKFESSFDIWIEQIDEKYFECISALLLSLHYYSRCRANSILVDLHGKLGSMSNANKDNIVYAYIKSDDGITNSSNDYWTEYKHINGLNRNLCFENLDRISADAWTIIENIVFIDDFSGSGDSIITELEKYKTLFKGKHIYIITICMMKTAEEALTKYGTDNEMCIKCIYSEVFSKAFQQNIFDNNESNKKLYLEFTKIKKIQRELGYKNTEALVAFYNNTPNNTLGFIHFESETYTPIFPRYNEEKPIWQDKSILKSLRHKAQKRKTANYNNACNNP